MTKKEDQTSRNDLPDIIECAKLTTLIAMTDSENRMHALLSAIASVYGSLQIVISLTTNEKVEGSDDLLSVPVTPGTNRVSLCFAALLTLKTIKPHSQGFYCNWGPHTIQEAIDACEKICGQKVEPYLDKSLLTMLKEADIESFKKKSSRLEEAGRLEMKRGMN